MSTRNMQVQIVVILVLLFSLLPSGAAMPQPVLAEGRVYDAPQAPSANAGQEIVYIDPDGFIRVLDIYHGEKQVQWVSPISGWRSIALGDFDNDGDMEIVAVRGTPGTPIPPELTVFDPVVATGEPIQGQEINGIPWKQIFNMPLPSRPELVFAGNFDSNVPGDEFGVSRQIVASDGAASGDETRVVIYKQTSLTPTGTDWTIHVQRDFDQEWKRVAVGNLDFDGADEVGFVDEDKGEFNIYRPDTGLSKISGTGGSQSRPYRDIAFGQYIRGGNLEVLVVRRDDGRPGNPTCEVWEYDRVNLRLNMVRSEHFSPGPRLIATGDINGADEDVEAIMMRHCTGDCVRLIVRNDGGDGVIQEFLSGLRLDDDDGFRVAAAGDIDGDGRDEIILMRDSKIRWFPDAHNSARFEEVNVRTNSRNLVVGDLDHNGFITGSVIGSTPTQVQEIAYFGSIKSGVIRLQNVATSQPIEFMATTNATWLTVTPAIGVMPGRTGEGISFTYQIDARVLPAGNRFTANIYVISESLDVVNSPYIIPVTIDVEFPPFGASPESATAFYFPCEDPFIEQMLTMNVIGVPGTKFVAMVQPPVVTAEVSTLSQGNLLGVEPAKTGMLFTDQSGVQPAPGSDIVQLSAETSNTWISNTPWVTSVSSPSDIVPTSISLTISPTLRTTDFAETMLLLVGNDPRNPAGPVVGLATIRLACASQASWLPLVTR